MNRIGAAFFGSSHNFLRVEIAMDPLYFVRRPQVWRMFIGFGKYRCRLNSHFAERQGNADRDFAAIRDEDFSDHLLFVFSIQGGLRRSRKAVIPACPSSPARARAIASAVNSTELSSVRAATPKTNSFAAAIAVGADVRI